MKENELLSLKLQLETELKEDILNFWLVNTVDKENGGFYGYLSNELHIDKKHDKAGVLYSRILWTYSSAFRIYGEEKYLWMASRAYDYILEHFWDNKYSGTYWMVDYLGNTVNPKKQTYAIAFAIYGISEFYRATGNKESLTRAIELFRALESHAYDPVHKGYLEALARDWSPLEDMSLSAVDMNAEKSMNTHLHVLEAYTNLLRVWDSEEIKNALGELLLVTVEQIVDPASYSFKLFFDASWNIKTDIVSYGHDIEGSWLLYEAAEVLGDAELLSKVKEISLKMAQSVFIHGIDRQYGGLFNESGEIHKDSTYKDWWPQAEAVVGFFNAYRLSGEKHYWDACREIWDFIKSYMIDKEKGEWFWGVSVDGKNHQDREKVGPWKCPYHNSRMCFEIIHRINTLTNGGLNHE